MHILHVVESFSTGVLRIVRVLAEGMASDGHDVAIAYGTRPETPATVRDQVGPGVKLYAMPWAGRAPAEQIRAGYALRRLAGDLQPDLVHLHSTFAGFVGAAALGGGRPALLYTPHAFSFTMSSRRRAELAAYRAVERWIARRALIVGCSHDEARLAREVVGAEDAVAVPNGIPELDEGRAPAPAERQERRAVAGGRIGPQRRPDACARILAAVGDLADVAWIGGGDPGDPGARALSEAGVRVTGWLPEADAIARVASSFAYLHWSAWDGLPISALEAMARDVVVVASDIGPNREVLGPGQVCSSEREAAELLRAVLADRDHRESLLESQRSRRGAYGATRMVREMAALYERAISAGESWREAAARDPG